MGGDNRVDDVPDWREDEVTRTDLPATRPESTGPATGQVRIVGAEPAGEVTGELPKVTRADEPEVEDDGASDQVGLFAHDDDLDQPSVRLTDQPAAPEASGPAVRPVGPGQTAVPSGAPTELPHWTEPPTGQVPAVLARDTGDEGSGIEAPSWREEDADWVAHEELFEPGMFGDDQVALGSLDETDRTDQDRRPWEFDLDPTGSTPKVGTAGDAEGDSATVHPITEPVEVVAADAEAAEPGDRGIVRPDSGRAAGGSVAGMAAAAAGIDAAGAGGSGPGPSDRAGAGPVPLDDEPQVGDRSSLSEPALPAGTERLGRSRRSGLLPARLRAKRPEELADAAVPLAAEPPGASVTEVPGAGRKKRDVAGLAAADRTAEQDEDLTGDGTDRQDADAPGAVAGTAAAGGRRGGRRSSARSDRPSDQAGSDRSTGGGPPSPDRARRPRSGGESRPGTTSIGLRVGTGVAVAVIALLAFKLGTVASLVLVVVVLTFAAGECFGVLRRAGYRPATLLGLVGTISLTVGAYSKGVAALPLILVLITVFTLVWYLFGIERGSPVAGTAATLLAVGWVSLLGSYAGLILSPSAFPDRHGIAFLLGAIIATVANDVGALVVGGWMGRTPLAPSISPNKTWEGLLGGAVFTVLVSTVVVGAIHPWSAANAALLGVVVAVVAPIGDLCESLLKRDLRLKDMGTLLPGHGGVLDRVDALLFVLPATYYLVRALNIA